MVDQLAAKQAETVVRGWLCTQPIILAGVDLPAATAAICSILPLDRFVECPAQYMYPSPGSEVLVRQNFPRVPSTALWHTALVHYNLMGARALRVLLSILTANKSQRLEWKCTMRSRSRSTRLAVKMWQSSR